jgi:competence protein ComEC
MKEMRITALILVLLLAPLSCDTAVAKGVLRVAFLDVGQGDAIYIEAPNGNQMIIDGGPAGSLLPPLEAVMPFGDRSIDVVMVSNPDADHYAGFLDLFETYDVGAVIEPGTRTSTPMHAELQGMIARKNVPELMARKGMTITLDAEAGVTFTVLFPDRDVSDWTTNDGSIQGILSYGTTKIMFTGDGTKRTEAVVLAEHSPTDLASDIYKVPHHGSTTSSSEAFVAAVAPKYAVISSKKGNSYGLPKQETLDTLKSHGIETLRTDEKGTIIFISDGSSFTLGN